MHQFFLVALRRAIFYCVMFPRLVRGARLHVEETKVSNRVFAGLLLFSSSVLAQAPQGDRAELRALQAAVAASQSAGRQRRYSHAVDKATGVRSNHTVILTAIDSAKAYPVRIPRDADQRSELMPITIPN